MTKRLRCRSLSVDPMHSRRSWLTPYNYVQNNPVNLIDPTGMIDTEPDPMTTVDLKPVDVKPQSWLSRTWDSVKSFFGMNWLGGKEMYGDSPEQGVTHRDGNATGDPIDLTETLEMLDALLYRKDGFRFKPKTKPSGEVKGTGVAEAINPSRTGEAGEMPRVSVPEVPMPEASQPETLHVRYWQHNRGHGSKLIIRDTVVPQSHRGEFDRGMDSIRENQKGVFGKVYIFRK